MSRGPLPYFTSLLHSSGTTSAPLAGSRLNQRSRHSALTGSRPGAYDARQVFPPKLGLWKYGKGGLPACADSCYLGLR
jgi:hypothetical protein